MFALLGARRRRLDLGAARRARRVAVAVVTAVRARLVVLTHGGYLLREGGEWSEGAG